MCIEVGLLSSLEVLIASTDGQDIWDNRAALLEINRQYNMELARKKQLGRTVAILE